jgi:PAS domain S-box-containing protein
MKRTDREEYPQRNRRHILLVTATTIAAILTSLYCLVSGTFIVFQNLFYIPIILSCMYYTMRGFVYSLCLAVFYLLLILLFTSESSIITQALARVVLFIVIAGVVTLLSIRRKRSEQEKSAILKGLKDIIVEFVDADMTLIWGNDALSELTGKSVEELKGEKCYTFIYGRAEPCPGCSARKAIETGKFQEGEARTPDGRPWMTRSFPIVDQNGKTMNVVHIALDITERKRMEVELKEGEEIFSQFMEHSPIYVFFKDEHVRVLKLSKNYEALLGRPLHECIGKTMDDSFPPDLFRGTLEDDLKVLREGKPVVIDEELSGRFYTTTKFPVFREGKPPFLAGFTVDITDRRKAEERLENDQIRLTAVLDSIDALVYVADLKSYEILFLNKYGRGTWSDIAGRRCWETIQEDQEGPCKFCTNDRLLSDSGTPAGVYHWEFQNTKNGRWYDCRDQAIRWIDGRLVRLEIATDITERKLAEEKIRNLLSEKELLLREVHHRIKNNMNIVMSLLSLQASTLKDPSVILSLEDARSRVQSMMVLYDKLYQSADFRKISTREYLTSLIDEIVMNFPDRRLITIEKRIDDAILDAKILSPVGIILNELLTNIMKHAFVGKDKGVAGVFCSIKKNHATLVIEDNGIGVPESTDITTSTGFGMQLVGILTEQLEGTIRLERLNGSKFILEFDI